MRLRRSALFFIACTLVGGLVGLGAAWLRGPRYRATATLLVVEPRGAPPGSVDFQLTPVRSYIALLTSPALAAGCAAGGQPDRVRVRMPESTRLLEVSAEGKDAARVAALASCVASSAVEENRRLNADVARRGESQVVAALAAARAEAEKQEDELARLRAASLIEVKRALLKAALADVASATDEERMARRHVDEEDARSASFEEGGSKWPRARETTEGGVVTARANAAAARAAVASAARARAAAESRATSLEREIASRESELGRARRRAEGAAAGLTELERRTALAPLDSASKAFDLQLVAPPPSLAPRAGPPPLLMAAVGAFAAVFLGALLVLSRPE